MLTKTPHLLDDNATPHQTKLVQQHKVTNQIANFESLAHSPNCNADENIWDHLQWNVYKQPPPFTTLAKPQAALATLSTTDIKVNSIISILLITLKIKHLC